MSRQNIVQYSNKVLSRLHYKPTAPPQSSCSAASHVPLWDKADICMSGAIVTPTNYDMLVETWIM